MKTDRKADSDTTTPLPPAPAPTSRDANPWTMADSGGRPAAGAKAGKSIPPRLHPRHEPASPKSAPRERSPLARLVPAVIAAGVVITAVINLIESANGGDAVEALIPLAFVLVFGVMMLRRALRRRDR